MARLTRISGSNFLRLRAVEIEPDGSACVIGGKNEQGKTSVMRIVRCLLGGKKEHPAEPLRDGAGKGKISIDVADAFEMGDLRFERSVSSKGLGSLKITCDQGAVLGGPQAIADKLKSSLMFDPMAFDRSARERPKDAGELLRAMVGLDVTAEQAENQRLRNERIEIGREVKRLKGAADSLPCHNDAPATEVKITTLMAELERRRQYNAATDELRGKLDAKRTEGHRLKGRIEDLQARLAAHETQIEDLRSETKNIMSRINARSNLDCDEIRTQVTDAEQINQQVRDNIAHAATVADARAAEDRYADLSSQIRDNQTAIDVKIEAVEYPIGGLELTADGVLLDGHPWEQASMSRRIKASTAIGFAQNPELRLLLIEGGAYLDQDNLQLVAELAEQAGGMALIEVVGETGAHVVIEDGEARDTK